jgi:hypothetical protein
MDRRAFLSGLIVVIAGASAGCGGGGSASVVNSLAPPSGVPPSLQRSPVRRHAGGARAGPRRVAGG